MSLESASRCSSGQQLVSARSADTMAAASTHCGICTVGGDPFSRTVGACCARAWPPGWAVRMVFSFQVRPLIVEGVSICGTSSACGLRSGGPVRSYAAHPLALAIEVELADIGGVEHSVIKGRQARVEEDLAIDARQVAERAIDSNGVLPL